MRPWLVVATFEGSSVYVAICATKKDAERQKKRYINRETFGIPRTFTSVDVVKNTNVDRIWHDI